MHLKMVQDKYFLSHLGFLCSRLDSEGLVIENLVEVCRFPTGGSAFVSLVPPRVSSCSKVDFLLLVRGSS